MESTAAARTLIGIAIDLSFLSLCIMCYSSSHHGKSTLTTN
jgi:hypothetical protein